MSGTNFTNQLTLSAYSTCLVGSNSAIQESNKPLPVLGGVDMVQFFTAFKLPDGSYNESEVGQRGSDLFSSVYNNQTFYFVSEENRRFVQFLPLNYVLIGPIRSNYVLFLGYIHEKMNLCFCNSKPFLMNKITYFFQKI
jgi:YHS domain-containing protein